MRIPSVKFKTYQCYKSLALAFLFTLTPGCACWAQLPPTNMGQFVHQPGDNQYTAQTQLDRHHLQGTPVIIPAGQSPMMPISSDYRPTPAAAKPDISLLPIVADEPIKPAGFPPLPDRLDLPTNGTGFWAGNNGGTNNNGTTITTNRSVSSSPSGVHQHYYHYEPGAFIPPQELQQTTPVSYRPRATDYYNINPAAKSAPAVGDYNPAVNVPTPATNALQKVGPEPQLAADGVSKPEAPNAVTVNQSVSQDLSLPEDDFNKHYPTSTGNSNTKRTATGIGRMLSYPLQSLGYTATGMIMGTASSAAGMAGMYAIHR